MLKEKHSFVLSTSVTTRSPRPGEVDGVHYHFRTLEQFEDDRKKGKFLEYAKVHGNYYGTLASTVEDALKEGRDILFDIDYQGVKQLQEKITQDVVSIFILPPSKEELRRRLELRAQDSAEVIERRIANAAHEIENAFIYDYVLINENLEQCYQTLEAIYCAEQHKRKRNFFWKDLSAQFLAS